jgi:hypothetical protein
MSSFCCWDSLGLRHGLRESLFAAAGHEPDDHARLQEYADTACCQIS